MPTYTYQQKDMNSGQFPSDDLNVYSNTPLPSSSTWESMHNQDLYLESQTAGELRGGAQPPTLPGPVGDSVVIFIIISCIYALYITRKRKKRKSGILK